MEVTTRTPLPGVWNWSSPISRGSPDCTVLMSRALVTSACSLGRICSSVRPMILSRGMPSRVSPARLIMRYLKSRASFTTIVAGTFSMTVSRNFCVRRIMSSACLRSVTSSIRPIRYFGCPSSPRTVSRLATMLRTPLHGVRICRSSNEGRSDCSSWSSREAIRSASSSGKTSADVLPIMSAREMPQKVSPARLTSTYCRLPASFTKIGAGTFSRMRSRNSRFRSRSFSTCRRSVMSSCVTTHRRPPSGG